MIMLQQSFPSSPKHHAIKRARKLGSVKMKENACSGSKKSYLTI